MSGVNPTIQLAAALDRRGVTVSIDLDRVRIHLGEFKYIVIKPRTEGVKVHDYGREAPLDLRRRGGQTSA